MICDWLVFLNYLFFYFCYIDIRLDWETFVIDPSDEQLIDLSCYFGNPFPLLDQNGVEVVDDEDYGQTDQEQESLIKIILSEHQGQKSTLPFNIINKQMVSAEFKEEILVGRN